jgi:hypothetical protein
MRAFALLAVAVSCRPDGARMPAPIAIAAVPTASLTVQSVTPAAPHVGPHAGSIELVAVTDQGDAALTADTHGGLLLWPTLDGSREPVAIELESAAVELAIGHRPEGGFVIAARDAAGGTRIAALDDRGVIQLSAQLGIEPACVQVVALGGDVLIRRADHSVLRIDSTGRMVGGIVAPPGTRIDRLVVRRQAVLALAVVFKTRIVRRLDVTHGLAWGAIVALPVVIKGPVSLAPSGNRLAVVAAKRSVVIALSSARVIAQTGNDPILGFIDDDHARLASGDWLVFDHAGDGWSIQPPGARALDERLVIADHHAIGPEYGGLEPLDDVSVEHLGYHVVATSLGGFDGELRDTTIDREPFDTRFFLRLDDRHAAVLQPGPVVVDHVPDHYTEQLDRWDDLHPSEYDAQTHVFGVILRTSMNERRGYLYRYDPATATLVRARELGQPWGHIYVADPRLAGIAAVVSDGRHFEAFPSDPRARSIVRTIDGHHERPHFHEASEAELWAVDRAGTVYATDRARQTLFLSTGDRMIRVPYPLAIPPPPVERPRQVRMPMPVARKRLTEGVEIRRLRPFPDLLPSPNTDAFALLGPDGIALVAKSGRVRWTQPVRAPVEMRWADPHRLVVMTSSGLLSLDAETGEPVARACAWEFGRTTKRLPDGVLAEPTVCD